MTVINHEEHQYLNLINDILEKGHKKSDRTGTGTLSLTGASMRFNLERFPLLTTKKVFIRGVIEELLFFIRGDTNNSHLVEKGVNIWTPNSTKEFYKKYNIDLEENDLGPIYGFQWRHFGAKYIDKDTNYTDKGIDQLKKVIYQIKNNPSSRRHLVVAWNPMDLDRMALPPCHVLFQFVVRDEYLDCIMYQRSGDVGLGVPFNIASYSLLTCMIAQVCNLKPGEFIHFIGDAHVYLNHVDALKIQIKREPRPFPTLLINKEIKYIEDFGYEDFQIIDYDPWGAIKMDMAV